MRSKLYSFLAILLLMLSGEAMAASQTITVGSSTGTFYRSGSTALTVSSSSTQYASLWTSTATSPQLSLACSGNSNNMIVDGQFRIHTSTYTLSVDGAYKITGYVIKGYTNYTSGTSTITPSGESAVTISTTSSSLTTVSVAGLDASSTTFSVSTASPWIIITSFTVTVEENTALDFLSNTKAYTITCNRGSLGVADGSLVSTAASGTTYEASNFAILKYNDAYYLFSVEANRFITSSGGTAKYSPDPITMVALGNDQFQLLYGSNAINVSSGYTSGLVINSWTTLDDGNQYTITEAESFDPTEALAWLAYQYTYVTDLSSLSNSKAYVVTNARGTWNIADGATSMTTLGTFDIDATNEQFAIISREGYYFLYSINAGKFLASDNTLSDIPQEVSITSTGSSDYPFFFSFDSSHNVNVNGSGTVLIDSWSTIDAGNSNAIIEAATVDLTSVIATVDNYLNPSTIDYTVSIYGGVAATVTVGGSTYSDGATFTTLAANALTENDITVTVPTGYAYRDLTVSTTGDQRTITVQVYYDLTGKTRITDLSTLSATHGYVLNNYYNEGQGCGVMVANGEELTLRNIIASSHSISSNDYKGAYVPTNASHVWQLLTENDNYYLYNPGVEKFVYWNGTYYSLTSSKTTINVDAVTDDNEATVAFAFNHGTLAYRYACAATQYSTSPIRWWYSTDADCQWEILEADLSNLSTLRTYVIDVTGLDDCDDYDADDEYRLGTDTYCWSDGDEARAAILLEAGDVTVPEYTGYSSSVTIEGNVIHIAYSNVADLTALETAVAKAQAHVALIGTGIGKYTAPSNVESLLTEGISTAQALLDAESVSYSQQSEIDALVDALDNLVNTLSLNMPESGKYYRLKSVAGTYLTAPSPSGDSSYLNTTTSEASAANIFYLTNSQLLSYYNPTYMTATEGSYEKIYLSEPSTAGHAIDFERGTKYAGSYRVPFTSSYYLYDWTTWNASYTLISSTSVEDPETVDRNQWYIEEVDTLPLTLSQIEDDTYATLYLPVAVTVTGATVYVPSLDNGVMKLTAVNDGVVPANTAVILKGTETSATAVITTTSKTLSSALSGSISSVYAENVTSPYVFSYRNGVLGFFKYTGLALMGNKAYYSSSAAVEGFTLEWDDVVDGIEQPATSQASEDNALYDLSGRRIGKAMRGLYIRNGKKYIVK